MINRRAAVGLLLGGLAGIAAARAANPSPAFLRLDSGAFARLVEKRRSQPFLLVLWSVTCGPCREEFALLREMRSRYPRMPLVLISTDDISDEDVAARAFNDYGMVGEESWIFAGDAQRLRYEIDPEWYGELPRAYFYAANHARVGISGSLAPEQIEGWVRATGSG